MLEGVRKRLTFANVMSVIAVFIALSAGAWALTRNSVGSRQIQKDAVNAAEIAEDAVRTSEVKDEALNGEDVVEASLGQVPRAKNAKNADQLGGLDSNAFPRVVALLSDPRDYSLVKAATCSEFTVPAPGSARLGDRVEIRPTHLGSGVILLGDAVEEDDSVAGGREVAWVLCNVGATDFDPAAVTQQIVILRP